MRLLAFCSSCILMSAFILNGAPGTTTEARRVFQDVVYSHVGDTNLSMDGELPLRGEGPFPTVILVHGGGWMRGERTRGVSPLFQPLRDAGMAWFSISYRLASDFGEIGSAVQDVVAAGHFLRDHAAEYNIDPNRIAVLGESAGGHLAAMAAFDEPKLFGAVVGFYSPTNLVDLAENSAFVPEQIRDVLRNSGFAPLLRMHLKSLSPVEKVRPDAPPFLLLHGTSDPVVPESQSEELQRRLKQAGVPCDLIIVKGGGHGMYYWDRFEPTVHWRSRAIEWLKANLNAPRQMPVADSLTHLPLAQ